jgi:predicted CoA-binding protein
LIVYGASPGRYSSAELLDAPPEKGEAASVFPPESEGETSFLVFRRLDAAPPSVDVVAVYRPAEEIPGIIAAQVLPLGARILWLQPPITSAEARRTAADRGLRFVEGVDIATTARQLSGR